MPINSRAKGARTERELSQKLREIMGWGARRTVQFCGKAGDSDVLVPEIPQLFVESKAVQRLNVQQAMERAAEDAKPLGKLPVLMHKRNRSGWLLTIRLEDLPMFTSMVEASRLMRAEVKERS